MKKNQILFVVILGILTLTITSVAVQARGGYRTTNIRSIEDWVMYNPFGIGVPWETVYVGGDTKGNNYWMFIDSLDGAFTGDIYEYSGHVKEKLLKDGSIEITVDLKAIHLYVEMYLPLYDENGDPIWSMRYFGDMGYVFASGYADYYFQMKFILDAEYEGYEPAEIPPGTRELGCPLPSFEEISYIPREMGIHLKSLKLLGFGEIYTYEPGWIWPAPDEPWPDPAWPDPDGRTGKLFFLECAKFDESIGGAFGPPAWGYWPFGSSSDFYANIIRVFNFK